MDQTDIQPRTLDHFTGDDFSPYRFFYRREMGRVPR
jgi:type I pantothenate kinase